jgi:pimeloyl-ACP methyl ester carboxylesterase
MKRGCWISAVGGLAGLIALLAAAYLLLDREKLTLNPSTRAALGGQYISLPGGVTHYQLSGPEDGQPVVLVHGFSVASYTWDHTAPALAEAGFRVLTYDLYGRGYSDRPPGPYNLDLFTTQLNDLLIALHIDQPVDVVGLSMGGYITADFAARYPERVRRVALLAPQSVSMDSAPYTSLVTLPVLGEYLFTVYIGPYYMSESSGEFESSSDSDDWCDRYLDMMKYVGFRHALLSTLRTMTGDPYVAYRALGQLDRPVLLLWGGDDDTSAVENAPLVMGAIPQAEFTLIPGARHAFAYEFPEKVNPPLIAFLQR